MKNQRVGTLAGSVILIIISVTTFIFVWTYEKNLPQINMPTSKVVVPEKVVSVIYEPEEGDVEDCSSHEDERRICKDGTLVGTFDLECRTIFCPAEKTDENDETFYYSPFIKKGSGIFLAGQDYEEDLTAIAGADVATFRPINTCASVEIYKSYYGKDKNRVYVESDPVENIDSQSFKYLGLLKNGYGMPYFTSVSVDKNHVYFGCGTVVDSVDRNSFKILKNSYSNDKNRIYYLDFTVPAADYKTFEVLETPKDSQFHGNFALDKNYVFAEGMVLKGIDPKTCKSNGLIACLPNDWDELMDDSTQGEKLSNVY